jgi:hypothetical protein
MSDNQKLEPQFPLKLTLAQRKAVAEFLTPLCERLRLDEPNERLVSLTLNEMRAIHETARLGVQKTVGMKRYSLRHVVYVTEQAIERFQGIGKIPVKDRIYQLKIRLKGLKPPIWRRIQMRDCTLDKLHERIQTSLGWTNSHLHRFRIDDKLYGDPLLMEQDFDEYGYADSRVIKLSNVVPRNGQRFFFEYEYDFGDSWHHEVLFEGCLRSDPGARYPLCLEGERACPPEDVGGTSGYRAFLRAVADREHEEHEENLRWVGGSFEPEAFDPEKATNAMQRGLPNWRKMEQTSSYRR